MASLLNRFTEYSPSAATTLPSSITSPPLNIVELWKQLVELPDITAAYFIPQKKKKSTLKDRKFLHDSATINYRYIAVHSTQRDSQVDDKRSILQYYIPLSTNDTSSSSSTVSSFT